MISIYSSYNVDAPVKSNKYKINIKNEIVRKLLGIYKTKKEIPYIAPLSDDERKEFENAVIKCKISCDDDFETIKQNFLEALENPNVMSRETKQKFLELKEKLKNAN